MKLNIHLINDISDIENIKEIFESYDGTIKIHSGDIVLTTSTFTQNDIDLSISENLLKICSKIKSFFDSINGGIKLYHLNKTRIEIKKITYKDKGNNLVELPSPIEINMCLAFVSINPEKLPYLAPLSMDNKSVAKALRLYSQELDWVNLYRIYEIIKEDIKKFPKQTHNKIKIFKQSANKSSISGDTARHGTIDHKGELPKEMMSQRDAKLFIVEILKEWIDNKISH